MGGKNSKQSVSTPEVTSESDGTFEKVPLTPKQSRRMSGALFDTSSDSSARKHRLAQPAESGCCPKLKK